ncbi:MAG: ComEC/Rec2 family competence protein [Bacteroidota bacterium]
MSAASHLPFVRICLAFIGGITLAHYIGPYRWVAITVLGVSLVGYALLTLLGTHRKAHVWRAYGGLLGLVGIVALGYLYLLRHKQSPYTHTLAALDQPLQGYVITVIEEPETRDTTTRLTAVITHVRTLERWESCTAKLRLCIKSAVPYDIRYGDVYGVVGQPSRIPAPRNPHTFDYRAVLQREHIYYQDQVVSVKKLGHAPPKPYKAFFLAVRRHAKRLLIRHIHTQPEQDVMLALVLGMQSELDLSTKTHYINAGTMHILAVSGLHVGMLYSLLNFLLSSLMGLPPRHIGRNVLILVSLGSYACLTGLAPSVLRATLMLSCFLVAGWLSRIQCTYNTLASSAFLLLMAQPHLLFSVSFQLSYLAVGGIVYLQPRLYRCIRVKHWGLDRLWRWTTLSLAAQLAITPISLYYFKQFATYFIVANWIVVPAAFVILGLGLGILLTSWFTALNMLVSALASHVTGLNNRFVAWISNLPGSTLQDIYVDMPWLWVSYSLAIALLMFLQSRKLGYLLAATGIACAFGLYRARTGWVRHGQQGVIFYSIPNHQAVSFIQGPSAVYCADTSWLGQERKYQRQVAPSYGALGLQVKHRYSWQAAAQCSTFPLQTWQGYTLVVWGRQQLVFVDHPPVPQPYPLSKIHADFLILERNAVRNLATLVNQFAIDTLLIGASNSAAVAWQLQVEAAQYNIDFHSLRHNGAYTAYG